ncbi:hypothetical protein BDA96_02G108100 [Sorghum bicolor]|jgi:hypothetical protein|uniref:Uncharacterized protein n=1 Tax=Sorghum bicolor TaxID=4558 RepID=A0A921UTA3_SORBI|nr:hypothetical protein BDA96_02G108100 [Sorghum bicolor]
MSDEGDTAPAYPYEYFFDHWNHIDSTVRLAGEMANADADAKTVRLISSSKQFSVAFFRVPGGRTFIFLSWTSFVMKLEQLLLCGFSFCLLNGSCNRMDGYA